MCNVSGISVMINHDIIDVMGIRNISDIHASIFTLSSIDYGWQYPIIHDLWDIQYTHAMDSLTRAFSYAVTT